MIEEQAWLLLGFVLGLIVGVVIGISMKKKEAKE